MLFHLYLLGKVSKKRLFGTARVLAYGTVVSLGLGAITVKSAVANVGDESMHLGRTLAGLQDLIHGTQEVRLNGESVFFSANDTEEPLATVLDRFEKHCNSSRAFDAIEWQTLGDPKKAAKMEHDVEERGVDRFGIVRKQDESAHDGVVMCFTKQDKSGNFLGAVQKFSKSGDLHDLGDVRYVHAVQHGAKTYIQVMWTDGSFNLRKIMGNPGQDSVGSDFATLPRPNHSTRTITAEMVGSPYAARIYESTDAPEVALQSYADTMLAHGWSSVTSPDVELGRMGFDGRYFIKPETAEQAVVSVAKDNQDKNKTMVVVASVATIPTTNHLKPQSDEVLQ